MSEKKYFDPEDLKKFGNITEFQESMGQKFFDYYAEVFKEGALTEREKALIALAVGCVNCLLKALVDRFCVSSGDQK